MIKATIRLLLVLILVSCVDADKKANPGSEGTEPNNSVSSNAQGQFAANLEFTISEDGFVAGTFFSDAMVDYKVSLLTQPKLGKVKDLDTKTGKFSYYPNPDINGEDSFTYQIETVATGFKSNIGTVKIKITPMDDRPNVSNLALSVMEDEAFIGNLPIVDVDAKVLEIVIVSKPENGTLTLIDTKSAKFKYVPKADFSGDDSFTFRAREKDGETVVATVSLKILAVNDPPVAQLTTFNGTEDTPVIGLLSALDIDSSNLMFEVVQGTGCMVELIDAARGKVKITPNPDFRGTAVFSFKASDGSATSNVAEARVNFANVNDAPVAPAQPILVTTPEGTDVTFDPKFTDADGDVLTYFTGSQASDFVVNEGKTPIGYVQTQSNSKCIYITKVRHGYEYWSELFCMQSVNGSVQISRVDPDFVGDIVFDLKAHDASGVGHVSQKLTLRMTPVNDPPTTKFHGIWYVSIDQNKVTTVDFTNQAVDVDGDVLTLSFDPSTVSKKLLLVIDGLKVHFIPTADYPSGVTTINFLLSDGQVTTVIPTYVRSGF